MIHFKTRYLEEKNPITVEKIKFEDEGHHYFAYSKFYEQWVTTKDGAGGLPIMSTTSILKEFFHNSLDAVAFNIWNNEENQLLMKNDPTYRYFGCKSVDDIRKVWLQGAIAGTRMHACFEDMVNILEFDRDNASIITPTALFCKTSRRQGNNDTLRETFDDIYGSGSYESLGDLRSDDEHFFLHRNMSLSLFFGKEKDYDERFYFLKFLKSFGMDKYNAPIRFYRTELLMWHSVLHISGTIDALLYNESDDSFIIVDWKRVKGGLKCDPKNPRKPVSALSYQSRGLFLPSFKKLRNNSFNKYGCQLTLYKHMFEHMTGKKVSGMFLVAVDSTKIGKKDAMAIHEVKAEKFNDCIRDVFALRAKDMLDACDDKLDDDHMDELLKYLPPDSSYLHRKNM